MGSRLRNHDGDSKTHPLSSLGSPPLSISLDKSVLLRTLTAQCITLIFCAVGNVTTQSSDPTIFRFNQGRSMMSIISFRIF